MQGPNGEMNGTDILVSVETVPDSGVFAVVGSQRGATFAEATAPIDASSKEKRAWVGLPGRYTTTITLEHLYIPSTSGFDALRNAMRNGTYVKLRRRELNVEIEEANCVITNMSQSAPDQDVAVVSADFQLSDGWTPVV